LSPRQTTIEGYASLWWITDLNKDQVAAGAFAHSLLQRPAGAIRMLSQHARSPVIGVWDTVLEDPRGLFVRGRIISDNSSAILTAGRVRAGLMDGLSIGFRTLKSRPDGTGRLRILTEIELWEISIVSFPMLPEARLRVVQPGQTASLAA
jgi:hypothetical protein